MSDTKIFSLGENGGSNGGNSVLAMLPALLQRQGVDPGLLALCQNRNGNGWGDDGIFGILLLFILMGAFNGGWGGFGGFGGGRGFGGNGQGGVVPMLNNDANTAVIMQAVQRNGFDISTLATALNTSSDAVQAAISALSSQLCSVGNSLGLGQRDIQTAVMQGNNGIITQICNCCCDLKSLLADFKGDLALQMCNQTNTFQNAINNVAVGQERGFSSMAYESQRQTCDILGAIDKQTQAMVAQFAAIKEREDQREIQNLRDQVQAYQLSASQQQQTANIVGQLQPVPRPSYIVPNPYGCGCNNYGYPFANNGCNNGCGC